MSVGFKPSPDELLYRMTNIVFEGIGNVSDDTLVYDDEETHDPTLDQVRDQLEKFKCKFRKPKIEFYDLRISDDGFPLTESKTRAH
jgi:hypothetical protein